MDKDPFGERAEKIAQGLNGARRPGRARGGPAPRPAGVGRARRARGGGRRAGARGQRREALGAADPGAPGRRGAFLPPPGRPPAPAG
jgi:hypothetical protein